MSFPSIKRFKGLNNVSDPLRLDLGWLAQADNVDITNTGAVEARRGYVRRSTAPISAAFSSADFRRTYVVSGGSVQRLLPDFSLLPIAALTGTGRMHWTEVNKQVFFSNGVDAGIITEGGQLLPWMWPEPPAPRLAVSSGSLDAGVYQVCFTFLLADGRETGAGAASAAVLPAQSALQINDIPQLAGMATQLYIAPAGSDDFRLVGTVGTSHTWSAPADSLGAHLTAAFLDPLPTGCETIQHWRGQMFASQYLPAQNQTVVWSSEPLGFHLFNLNDGYFLVPGQVRMLAPTPEALVIGTDAGIHAYDGERMELLAPYGVPNGWQWVVDEDGDKPILMIWTDRGACRAMPFANITQEYISVPPGLQVGAALVRANGHKKLVANLVAGGTAFNQRQ